MKKSVLVLSLLLVLACILSACYARPLRTLSNEEIAQNLPQYDESLRETCTQYGFSIEENTDGKEEERRLRKQYTITIDDDSSIEIWVGNPEPWAHKDDGWECCERFDICYTTASPEKGMDLKAFTELANCVSGYPLSEEFCRKFLDAKEEEYPAKRYGRDKPTDIEIYKIHSFDFSEGWRLFYTLYKDDSYREGVGELEFMGITKDSVKPS